MSELPTPPAVALSFVEKALTEVHAGRMRTWTEFAVPEEAIGCGFHEAVRGMLSHHVVIRNGKIANCHPYPRILAFIENGGVACRPPLEQLAQDDLLRSLLFYRGLHPIPLRPRFTEAIENLRPLVESYGGRVSITDVSPERVTVRLDIAPTTGPSPSDMLKELLEHAS